MPETNISQLSARLGDCLHQRGQIEDQVQAIQQQIDGLPGDDDRVFNLELRKSKLLGQVELLQSQSRGIQEQLHAAGGVSSHTSIASPLLASSEMAGPRGSGNPRQPSGLSSASGRDPMVFRDVSSDKVIRCLEPTETVSQSVPTVGLGDYCLSRLGGSFADLASDESQAMVSAASGNQFDAGGVLLPGALSETFIDLARAQAKIFQAGARTAMIDSGALEIARLTADPTAVWRGEENATPTSVPSFGSYTVRPRMLACIVPVSVELLEDANNAGEVIEKAIRNTMASELDRVALLGEPVGSEPKGLKHTDGVQTISSVGTPSDWSDASSAIRKILDGNYPYDVSELCWLAAPREAETYDGLSDSTGQPLQMPPLASKLRRLFATAIPITDGGGAESSMYTGYYPEMVVFIRRNITLEILRSGVVGTGADEVNLGTQFEVALRASLRADVLVMQPGWFCVASGVTSA